MATCGKRARSPDPYAEERIRSPGSPEEPPTARLREEPHATATPDTRRRAAAGVPGMAAAATAPRKQLAELVLVVLLASLSICLIGHF